MNEDTNRDSAYRRTGAPSFARYSLASAMMYSPKWKFNRWVEGLYGNNSAGATLSVVECEARECFHDAQGYCPN